MLTPPLGSVPSLLLSIASGTVSPYSMESGA
jgi:hypothetical protein